MKRLTATVMTLAMLLMMVVSFVPAMAATGATLKLVVSYAPNAMFSVYDAEVWLDDDFLGKISQDEIKTFTINEVPTGVYHTVSFYESGNHSKYDGSHQYSFIMYGDSKVDCSINAHWYGVRVMSSNLTEMQSASGLQMGTSTFTYEITNERNSVWATYPIDMYIDDEKICTINNSYTMTGAVEISNGSHTIYFYDQKQRSVNNTVNIIVDGDTRFSCWLKAHEKYIDVNNVSTNATVR